ncbi:MAG: hypothetical protein EBU85_05040 [Actinobacteria bacterium]|nr:hypothetical protein [Actinomycetota bacterium]
MSEELENKADTEIWAMLPELEPRPKSEALRVLAERAMNRREYSQAASLAAEAAEIAVSMEDDRLAGWLFAEQATAVCRGGDCAEAIVHFERALGHHERVAAQHDCGHALNNIASCALNSGDYEKAFQAGVQARDLGWAEEDYRIAGWGAFHAGKALFFDDKERESLDMLAQAREAFRTRGDVKQVAFVDDFSAGVHDYLEDREEALSLYGHCLRVAETIGKPLDIAYAQRRYGKQLARLQRYDDALIHLNRARETYVAESYIADVAWIDRAIADALNSLDRDDEAMEVYERAQALYDGLGDDEQANLCRRQRAFLLDIHGRHADSERLYRQILALAATQEDLHRVGWLFRVNLELCDLVLRRGEFDEVLELTGELPASPEDLNLGNRILRHVLRARAYFGRSEWDDALHEVEQGIALTTPAQLNDEAAYLFEIRALIGLERGVESAERDLAHAIALHLASGEDDRARELASHFMPTIAEPDPEAKSESAMSPASPSSPSESSGDH